MHRTEVREILSLLDLISYFFESIGQYNAFLKHLTRAPRGLFLETSFRTDKSARASITRKLRKAPEVNFFCHFYSYLRARYLHSNSSMQRFRKIITILKTIDRYTYNGGEWRLQYFVHSLSHSPFLPKAW